MKRFVRILPLLFIALVMFSGCDIEINPSITLSKIITLCDSKEHTPFMTEISIRFEISGESSFNEDKDKITEILGNYFTGINHVRMERNDFKAYYAADAKAPVCISENLPDDAADKIYINANKEDERYQILLSIGNRFIQDLNSNIPSSFMQKYDIRNLFFNFKIINDTGNDISAKVSSSYFDDTAVPFSSEFPIKNGDFNYIKISEVFRDYICSNGKGIFYEFTVHKK